MLKKHKKNLKAITLNILISKKRKDYLYSKCRLSPILSYLIYKISQKSKKPISSIVEEAVYQGYLLEKNKCISQQS